RMASVIMHAYKQIRERGYVNLFRSHREDVKDGGQSRDFVYVKDIVQVCAWLMHNRKHSGLLNLGTGKARSFYDLATSTFSALGLQPDIRFIDTPADIRDTYQYFTEADMKKLRSWGYTNEFFSLEKGVEDYVKQHLEKDLH
ncbi:MAG: NAD-dependent epimerase/dehydratase family protein, partial [Bacteroidetes bacterium]|nr:NAD-dependent epimerase/dehydratase family protein [Bacteroidota bacterium]